VTAYCVQCRATLLAMEAIRRHRPDAVFIQSEIAECFLEQWPETRDQVRFANEHRFITFDFLYGNPPCADVLNYLYDHGLTRDDFEWFMRHGRQAASHCVLGMDYYGTNEKVVEKDGSETAPGSTLGWGEIAMQYFERLLGEREGRRLVFAEGLWDEPSQLQLLATHLLDASIGESFFGDPLRMHRDLLSDAAAQVLAERHR